MNGSAYRGVLLSIESYSRSDEGKSTLVAIMIIEHVK
jgi:hypothetical protein